MCEGYHAAGEDNCSYSDLDEFLCEYVDGSMDPTVRAVFEEYLRANPALQEHVECLRRTRMMLCHYGCKRRAPEGIHARLHGRLGCEIMRAQAPVLAEMAPRLGTFAAFTSAVAMMMLVGIFVGDLWLVEPPSMHAAGEAAAPEVVMAGGQRFIYGRAGAAPLGWLSDFAQPHLSAVGRAPVLQNLQQAAALVPSDSHTAVSNEQAWQSWTAVP